MVPKFLFWSCLLINYCWSLDDSRSAKILVSNFENTGTGPYRFSYETSDGTSRQEEGTLVNPENSKQAALIVRGSYSYTDINGKRYTVDYTADKNGFHPEGEHIKVPPFVPWDDHHHHHDHDGDEASESVEQRPNQLYLPSSTVSPNYRYLPTTPAPVLGQKDFDDLRLQRSIIDLLRRNGHQVRIEEINSL